MRGHLSSVRQVCGDCRRCNPPPQTPVKAGDPMEALGPLRVPLLTLYRNHRQHVALPALRSGVPKASSHRLLGWSSPSSWNRLLPAASEALPPLSLQRSPAAGLLRCYRCWLLSAPAAWGVQLSMGYSREKSQAGQHVRPEESSVGLVVRGGEARCTAAAAVYTPDSSLGFTITDTGEWYTDRPAQDARNAVI